MARKKTELSEQSVGETSPNQGLTNRDKIFLLIEAVSGLTGISSILLGLLKQLNIEKALGNIPIERMGATDPSNVALILFGLFLLIVSAATERERRGHSIKQ